MVSVASQPQRDISSVGPPPTAQTSCPRRSGPWRWWLGGLVLAAYLLTASGHIQTIDAQQELQVAARLVHGGGLSIRSIEFQGGGTEPGRDGQQYAAHDLGMSFVYAPIALAPGAVTRAGEPTELMVFGAGFVNAVIGAAAVFVMADLLAQLGLDRRAAAMASLGFAFATMQWVYAHIAFDVTANALAILVAVWCVVRSRGVAPHWWLLAGGTALGLAVTIRTDTLLLVPFLSIPVIDGIWHVRSRVREPVSRCLAWAMPVAAGAGLNGWYNWFRFGSVFDNGHLHDPLLRPTTPVVNGLAGQLVSPGKGMLLFSPFALVALAGWPSFIRRQRSLAIALALAIVANLVAHARLADWSGAEAWGSRHTMQILALLVLPAAYLLDHLRGSPATVTGPAQQRHRLALGGIGLVALSGIAVQLTAVGADYLPVGHLQSVTHPPHNGAEWQEANWQPADSQIWLGAAALGRSLDGQAPYPDNRHGGIVPPPVPRLDLWWTREVTAERYVAAATVAPPLLSIALVAAAIGLVNALSDYDPDRMSRALGARSRP